MVKHILLECHQYDEIRLKQKLPETIYEVLILTSEISRKLIHFINKTEQ